MRNENATPLLSQPISEIAIDKVDQRYITRVQWYLEHELQCKITPLTDRDGYLIVFPAGTVEETYGGQSTQWTHKTLIRFPGGITLQKYVASPLTLTQRAQTILAFPNSILEGPEPPYHQNKQHATKQ